MPVPPPAEPTDMPGLMSAIVAGTIAANSGLTMADIAFSTDPKIDG
jgi:hypothetical protein